MNSLELIKWAEERHVYYCNLADKMFKGLSKTFKRPEFALNANKSRTAGRAKLKKGVCAYNLSYLLAAKENFERTIAHEVAHFTAWQLDRLAKFHGDLFKFVFNEFYGSREMYHYYIKTEIHVKLAKAIMQLRELKLEMLKDAAESQKK